MPQSSAQVDWARWRVENSAIVSATEWSVILAIVLEFVAVVGFFYVLRRAGAITWVGLVLWLVGLQLVLLEHVAFLVITESLSPRYLAVPEAARPAVDNVIFGVWRLAMACAALGNMLILGVALPIFAAAGLRLPEIPKGAGWGGIFIGVLYWVPIRYWPHPAFMGFMLWLCLMGVVLLRLKEQHVSS